MKTKATLLFLLIFFTFVSQAAIVTVQNTNDTGAGSLRSVVSAALSGDTIRFNDSLLVGGSDTIVLASEILIDKDLVFKGLMTDSTSLVISPDTNNRIFNVNYIHIDLVMDSMRFINPFIPYPLLLGGFIYANSAGNINIEIHNSTIECTYPNGASYSYLGGIYADASGTSNINLYHSSISGYRRKGAIRSIGNAASNILIYYSEIFDNHDNGIFSDSNGKSKVSIIHSSLLNNSTTTDGGAIYSKGTQSSVIKIDSSIISGNSADFGGHEGGGIYSYSIGYSKIDMHKTLFSNNTSGFFAGGIYCFGKDSSIVLLNDSTDFINNSSVNIGGIYAKSTNYTKVHINKSNLSGNYATQCCAGGVFSESQGEAIILIDSSEVKNNKSNTMYSSGGTGGVRCSAYDSAKIVINSSILSGNMGDNGGAIGVEGYYSTQSTNTSTVEINESTISDNYATEFGGGIYVEAHSNQESTVLFDINNSTISSNSAESGGGIYIRDQRSSNASSITIKNSTVEKNNATENGGGLHLWSTACFMLIEGSLIAENTADNYGAGISIYNGDPIPAVEGDGVLIKNSTFYKNIGQGGGGGIYFESNSDDIEHTAYINVKNSLFTENEAEYGGAICARASDHVGNDDFSISKINIDSSIISDNIVSRQGAGISSSSGSYSLVQVNHSSIRNNAINIVNLAWSNGGGGIYSKASDSSLVVVQNSTLSNNSASFETGKGGAIFSETIWSDWQSEVKIINSTLTKNAAYTGGGICSEGNLALVGVFNSTIYNNEATDLGGGIYANTSYSTEEPSIELKSSIIANNGPENIFNEGFAIQSNGYNIFSDSTIDGANILDQLAVDSTCLKLDTLKLNAGLTKTLQPLKGSVAINRGNPSNMGSAQDTVVFNGIRDIGASEYIGDTSMVIPVFDTTVCAGVDLFGIWYDASTMVIEVAPNSQGCDSVIAYHNLEVENVVFSQAIVEQLLADYPLNPSNISFSLLDCANGFSPVEIDSSAIGYSLPEGEYAMLINDGSCADTSECYTLSKLSIDENSNTSNNRPILFPNPAKSEVQIYCNTAIEGSLFMVDISGRKILQQTLNGQFNTVNLNLSHIPAGVYFIEFVQNGKTWLREQLVIR